MTTIRAAFYARVSSEQQAAAHTIESQLSALSERARSDGTPVPPERQFVDDGISGATLARPALDRLRDLAAVGAIDRIYVHSPDRLARNDAYQVLLLDEWRRANVELVLLNKKVVWYAVRDCSKRIGLEHLAPHDLRRTCARLCHTHGGELEQIQFLLGHASVLTTERYLGCQQNLGHPVNDKFRPSSNSRRPHNE